jgi:glycosyltransferase involved in cell wall biosynthesis
MAIKVGEVELGRPIRPLAGTEEYDRARLLVRFRGRPVGWVRLGDGHRRVDVSPERIREEIDRQLASRIVSRLLISGIEPRWTDEDAPKCTVVVCTRDRAELLQECLTSVRALDYPDFEVLVVDNAPSDDATRRLTSRLEVRYAREDRPGLDWARNRGLKESRGEIVAFVDDDARPDRGWLRALASAFDHPEVSAVSGMVVAQELETRAQILFEFDLGGMTQSLERRTIRRSRATARDLLWASSFAVGTNMAYRRSVFEGERAFDPALDVGTPTGSGGDLEMCHRLVANGHTMVYEPAALVWHIHRRTLLGLQRQLYANGTGFGSYLLTCARNGTVGRLAILRFALVEWLWGWILKRLVRPHGLPRRLVLAELRGAIRSPFAYLAARRHVRRIASIGEPASAGVEPRLARVRPELES